MVRSVIFVEAKDCGSSRGGQAESQVGKEATREAEHAAGKGVPSGSTFETWLPVSCRLKPPYQTWYRHIPFSLRRLNSTVGQLCRFRGTTSCSHQLDGKGGGMWGVGSVPRGLISAPVHKRAGYRCTCLSAFCPSISIPAYGSTPCSAKDQLAASECAGHAARHETTCHV